MPDFNILLAAEYLYFVHRRQIEVVARNRVGRTDHGWPAQPRIDLVAFGLQGSWMATVRQIVIVPVSPSVILQR